MGVAVFVKFGQWGAALGGDQEMKTLAIQGDHKMGTLVSLGSQAGNSIH